MGWKYIMFRCHVEGNFRMPGVEFPIIFPDKMVHSEMAAFSKAALNRMGLHAEPVSAGMIEHIGVLGLGGDSETLHLESRPQDADTIEAYSYAHGMDTPIVARVMTMIREGWRRHK